MKKRLDITGLMLLLLSLLLTVGSATVFAACVPMGGGMSMETDADAMPMESGTGGMSMGAAAAGMADMAAAESGTPSWMSCHWAQEAVTALGVVLVIQSLLHIALRGRQERNGISLAMIPTAAAAAVIPGGVIQLCLMETMRCRAVMRPAVLVICVLIAVCALLDVLLLGRKDAK